MTIVECILLTHSVTVVYQVDKIEWVSRVAELDGAFGLVHRVPAGTIRNSEMDRHWKRLQSTCFLEMLHLSRGYCEPSTGLQTCQQRLVKRLYCTVVLVHIFRENRQ